MPLRQYNGGVVGFNLTGLVVSVHKTLDQIKIK